jgi:AraC-like DNA-binding protein
VPIPSLSSSAFLDHAGGAGQGMGYFVPDEFSAGGPQAAQKRLAAPIALPSPPLLSRFALFDTRNPEEGQEKLSAALLAPKLTLRPRGSEFRAVANSTTVANSSLTYVEYNTPVNLRAVLDRSYLLMVWLEGRAQLRVGRSDFDLSPGEGAVLLPGGAFDLETSGRASALMFRVSKAALERQAMLLTEKILADSVQFDCHIRLNVGKGPSLLRALRFVAVELQDDSSVAQARAVQDNLEQMLIRALLETQPSQLTQVLELRDSQVVPRCVLRVERYIAEHLTGEISIEEMIAASGVSGRTMFSAFKKFRGRSPMAHVRHLRLQQVRRDLINAPPGTRVTDILTMRGITQFGRFAVIYKKMFGESPSQTIKR